MAYVALFVIKLNIGQLNGYSAPVRMKYWSHFFAQYEGRERDRKWSWRGNFKMRIL